MRGEGIELLWPGKYDAAGERSAIPSPGLRVVPTARYGEGPSQGTLIRGDNLAVMDALLRGGDQGIDQGIDLVIIDPPFATGDDFSVRTQIGEGREVLRSPAYSDRWRGGLGGFMAMLDPRLRLLHRLLADHGSLYVHLDANVVHPVKVLLDEIFGPGCFQREIIWRIGWVSGFKSRARNWIRNHDTILFYVKDPGRFTFNKRYIPYPPGYRRRDGKAPTGVGIPIDDVWNAGVGDLGLRGAESLDSIQIKSFSREKTGWATQKNESLLRRIIEASSRPGDRVADFFCGSGSTLAAAAGLGRRWIGCDQSLMAIHLARKRLREVDVAFTLCGLGTCEAKHAPGPPDSAEKGASLAGCGSDPALSSDESGVEVELRSEVESGESTESVSGVGSGESGELLSGVGIGESTESVSGVGSGESTELLSGVGSGESTELLSGVGSGESGELLSGVGIGESGELLSGVGNGLQMPVDGALSRCDGLRVESGEELEELEDLDEELLAGLEIGGQEAWLRVCPTRTLSLEELRRIQKMAAGRGCLRLRVVAREWGFAVTDIRESAKPESVTKGAFSAEPVIQTACLHWRGDEPALPRAELQVRWSTPAPWQFAVELVSYSPGDPDLLPDAAVAAQVGDWSDWVDAWALALHSADEGAEGLNKLNKLDKLNKLGREASRGLFRPVVEHFRTRRRRSLSRASEPVDIIPSWRASRIAVRVQIVDILGLETIWPWELVFDGQGQLCAARPGYERASAACLIDGTIDRR